ncbi:coatomer subunit delta-like [Xenia sp. Carnegie-2017]|uniref:coatomer subunit delta-like n=1 Tax=Xenia sp. Carnegie-2017 TaxID=2897299 RepID=UPI001F04E3E3|nr:coatomer subunit delta-like [Xenia sp. Carnegie-2017]
MVLLAAAICTKAGKAIVSRQFVEMSRSRVEGLLGAFPKLMNTGKQHTFVETESVRYVYQPLDKLYMLLITTKASNILEDLETLRLFSRVIPEYCKSVDEAEVVERSFELIFAFDEIVALGYRENVNLAQIRTFTEMDSHEEKVFQAVLETQQREAKELMKRKAKELQAARMAAAKGKFMGRQSMTGFGGSGKSSDTSSFVEVTPIEPVAPKSSKPARPLGSNKAMKLGSKGKDIDHFVDKLISEGTDIVSSSGKRETALKPAQTAVPTSGVHISVDEKISLTAGRDGGLQNMEVRGLILLRISDAEYGRITIAVENDDQLGFQLQTHPNVDKKLFNQDSVLGLKQSGKAFPLNADIGVLKWRLQTKDESLMPLTINCWPSENDGQCDVNIEYELQLEEMELKDVTISIPLPHGVGAPVVGDIEGDYHYDHKRSLLEWQLPVIDESNKSGSVEFTMPGHPDDFFPINVSFGSSKSFCDLKIKDVNIVEDGMPVKFSSQVMFSVDKYEIV